MGQVEAVALTPLVLLVVLLLAGMVGQGRHRQFQARLLLMLAVVVAQVKPEAVLEQVVLAGAVTLV